MVLSGYDEHFYIFLVLLGGSNKNHSTLQLFELVTRLLQIVKFKGVLSRYGNGYFEYLDLYSWSLWIASYEILGGCFAEHQQPEADVSFSNITK